jgi:hypothetical protein
MDLVKSANLVLRFQLEAYNGFSVWTPARQPGVIAEDDPGRAGKVGQMELAAVQPDPVPHRDRHDGGHPAAGCRGVAGDR